MAYNFVYTFKSKDDKNPWTSEIRSMPKGVASLPSIFKIMIKIDKGTTIVLCRMKYVEKDLNIGYLFRALGIQSDMDILKCICYDLSDPTMMEILRNSLESTDMITTENCLKFIGKMAKGTDDSEDEQKHMRKPRNLLEKSLLPHIGTDSESFKRKAYFIGYMIHKLLKAYLGQSN
jgi:DNA-directed RNA polymerase II subunit RPB2